MDVQIKTHINKGLVPCGGTIYHPIKSKDISKSLCSIGFAVTLCPIAFSVV